MSSTIALPSAGSQPIPASNTLSIIERPKLKQAWNRLKKLTFNTWWIGKNVVWICVTSAIVLFAPVVFHYEKECQMFEMQAQMMQAQQALNAPALN